MDVAMLVRVASGTIGGLHVLVLSRPACPAPLGLLPAALVEPLRRADLLLQAGGRVHPDVLGTRAEYAPVRVVLGNRDESPGAGWGYGVPETLEFDAESVRLAMIQQLRPRPDACAAGLSTPIQ